MPKPDQSFISGDQMSETKELSEKDEGGTTVMLEHQPTTGSCDTGTAERHPLKERFGFWSILGYQLSVMASWSNYLVIAGTYVNVGGPVALLYGALVVGFFQLATTFCLAEFASIWPHAGGSQYWISRMTMSQGNMFSYLTGWMNILAYLTGTASANFAGAQTLTGLISLLNGYEWPRYQIVLLYWALCLMNIPINICPQFYREFNIASFIWLGTTLLATIGIWASYMPSESTEYVFTEFINNSGWHNNGFVFLISLTQATYAATGLDACIHLSQETKNPKRIIPLVLVLSVIISTLLSFGFGIFLVYRIGNFSDLSDATLGQVYLELYTNSIGFGPGLAVATTIMLVLAIFVASQLMTAASRLIWAMALSHGTPFSSYFAHIDQRFEVPVRAFGASFGASLLLGLLYLAGDSAWNAIASSVTISYQLVYIAPVTILLYRGRGILPPRYFDLDIFPHSGYIVNFLVIAWGIFISFVSLFPVYLPVTPSSMNYAIIVFAIWAVVVGFYWIVEGRQRFDRQDFDEQ